MTEAPGSPSKRKYNFALIHSLYLNKTPAFGGGFLEDSSYKNIYFISMVLSAASILAARLLLISVCAVNMASFSSWVRSSVKA